MTRNRTECHISLPSSSIRQTSTQTPNMNSTILVAFSVLLVICSIQMISGTPIVSPLSAPPSPDLNDPVQRAEAENFARMNGVTKEEVDEYNRMIGLNPLPEEDPQSRMLFNLNPLKNALEFWNWSIFDGFRQFIFGRRPQPTTYRPVVVNNNSFSN